MKIVIIGAGGFGREVLSLINNINQVKPRFEVLGFADDTIAVGTKLRTHNILSKVNDILSTGCEGVVVAIGNPQTRKKIVTSLPQDVLFPNVIHPLAIFQDPESIIIGLGNIICAGTIFTNDIYMGNHCIVNLSCTIGHDAVLSDYSSIMPGVNISGGAKLEESVYVGTGAKLIKATTIGANSIIGAGAVVDTDVAPNQTVVGVPAKPIK